MLVRFFHWWFGELAALLPPAWRPARGRGGGVLLVEETAKGVALRLRQRGRVRDLGEAGEAAAQLPARLRRRLRRVLVRPLARSVLTREVELPAAAAADPRSALELNMDRYVPFRAEDVHFAFELAPRRGPQQVVAARLAVVPRERMERLLEPLHGLELRPCHELEAGDEDTPVGFAFEPPPRSQLAARLATGLLLAFNVALLALLAALPWQRQTEALQALEARLENERRAAQAVSVLEDRLAAQRAQLAFLADEASHSTSIVLVLEELSRLLPDDSWLLALHVGERSVRLQGYAARASSLIGVLQRSTVLGAARFGSPIVRDPATGKERFDLQVDLVQPSAGERAGERTVARAENGG